MSAPPKFPADSVLDEIRSTIASFESLRASGLSRSEGATRDPADHSSKTGAEQSRDSLDEPAGRMTFESAARQESEFESHRRLSPAGAFPFELDEAASEGTASADGSAATSAHQAEAGESSRGFVSFRVVDKTAKIMIVDDEPLNVMTFRQHLKMEGYENFVTTSNAREALHLLRNERPDVLLLDIRMPEISGLDILRVVGLDPILQHIPVLILTAASDPGTRKQALELGASDFLQKPIDPNELLPRVRNAVVIKKHFDMVSGEATRLEQQVERRTRQLEATRQQLILCLARAAEHRDNDTGNHVIRVGRYTAIIAHQMGYPETRLEMLEQALSCMMSAKLASRTRSCSNLEDWGLTNMIK